MKSDYQRIEAIIRYLDEHRSEQPDLATLSGVAKLSRYHLHRLFSDWAGITPKAFLKCLNLAHARTMLATGESVLATSLNAGLSGPSRLHDLCLSLEAASPGEIKSGGVGWKITAGFAESPFGTCLIGENVRGICHLSFVPMRRKQMATEVIQTDWPQAEIVWDCDLAERNASRVFARRDPCLPPTSLKAVVHGTKFQVRVWRALLEVPSGVLTSYSRLAESLGNRAATRAVASAVAKNSLAYLIPCHRVIRETGVVGQYRWGAERKAAMIAWETCNETPG